MKLEVKHNPNYAATVVRIHTVVPLENSDNLVGLPFFGLQAVVTRDSVKEGDLGILFVAEAQLSEDYCRLNSLFRHENLNIEPNKKGYLEDNRRVRAIKLRGNRSDALFMPLISLMWVDDNNPYWFTALKEGDQFDTINGHEICR